MNLGRLALSHAPPQTQGARPASNSASHAMKPRADRVAVPDGVRLACQHDERRLKRILRIVRVPQQAPAEREDHRTVTLDQEPKRQLRPRLLPVAVNLQELAIRQTPQRTATKKRVERRRPTAQSLASGHITHSNGCDRSLFPHERVSSHGHSSQTICAFLFGNRGNSQNQVIPTNGNPKFGNSARFS